MTKSAILALDQGTTSSRAILFDESARPIDSAQREFEQIYPDNGWVEHDPEAIWETTLWAARKMLRRAKRDGITIKAIGITNQRETTLLWNRKTGKPIYNAIVWQDRRTAEQCEKLREKNGAAAIADKTGLIVDPYFSATKIAWILDNVKDARKAAKAGELAFGTVDSFLIWRLTGGTRHVTDATNASRTNLFNIKTQKWDAALLKFFDVPDTVLPEVLDCADDFGLTEKSVLGEAIPILGVAGDQQAALIGQGCFKPGQIKSTYGTGCFVVLNTGGKIVRSQHRLLSTVGYRLGGKTTYALEGSIFVAGAAIQWLRDGLKIIKKAEDTEAMARSVEDSGGVTVVPAFTGLGAPHWDAEARGAVLGLTRATTREHIVRATLESLCYQTADLLNAMTEDGVSARVINVDGGMVANDWFCEYLSAVLGIPATRPDFMETTALGAAYLAGRECGLYPEYSKLSEKWPHSSTFNEAMSVKTRKALMSNWHRNVKRVLD
ncbi:glycerol kinase GlpK [Robiginitomaculum antarcticum]|uniref:glycerol kinase GlpK n=1 Tax=Robiginitomaculum antarcticum TaxID=437507 RepID=UPI0003699830|nr:glycerol kinase GlpK [Robiginitomaculum antarcticum]